MPLVVGLTGSIAAGKSTIAQTLVSLGAIHADADKLVHRLYDPGTPGFDRVVKEFGEDVIGEDGFVDRKVLGSKVFGKPEELKRLTDIVWPGIRKLGEEELATLKSAGHTVAVLEAAVMIEAGWEDMCDELWVVAVEPDIAVQRLATRPHHGAQLPNAFVGDL